MTKRTSRIFLFSFILYLIFAAVLAAVLILDIFFARSGSPEKRIKLFVGEKLIKTYYPEQVYIDGTLCFPASDLASLCGYTVAGDGETMTLAFDDKYAEFVCNGEGVTICNERISLSSPARLVGTELYIPVEFYEKYVLGLTIDEVEQIGSLVTRISADSDHYTLALSGDMPDSMLPESELFTRRPKSTKKLDFVADLSAYEQYMNPDDSEKYLLLVNNDNAIGADYEPEELTDLIHTRKDGRSTKQMEHCAAMAMEAMLKEAAANGYNSLSITSAYRPYSEQKSLFSSRVADYASYGDRAEALAAQSVARPGTSEHQTGLCADLHNLPSASTAFAATDEYKWLVANCHNFGFILRYPKDKTDITGIMFEPWHYRYVGRYHATEIMLHGLCLEEYVEKYYNITSDSDLSENEE